MKIIATSPNCRNMDPLEFFMMTDPNTTLKMQDLADKDVQTCDKWILISDVSEATGEEREAVFIRTTEGITYSSISPSFLRGFKRLFCNEGMPITKKTLDKFNVIPRSTSKGRICILFGAVSFRDLTPEEIEANKEEFNNGN